MKFTLNVKQLTATMAIYSYKFAKNVWNLMLQL